MKNKQSVHVITPGNGGGGTDFGSEIVD